MILVILVVGMNFYLLVLFCSEGFKFLFSKIYITLFCLMINNELAGTPTLDEVV